MTCDTEQVERELPQIDDLDGRSGDQDGHVLVTYPKHEAKLTARHEYDVHAAIVHGLASYVASLDGEYVGRSTAITRVVTDWADHEDGAMPAPTAVVNSTEIGAYSVDSQMGQTKPQILGYANDAKNRAVAILCSNYYRLNELTVTVMCEDKIQRIGVRRMLEDAFAPVEWRSGFRLILPRYHSAVAEYALVSAQQPDATQTATAALWPLVMRLQSWCAVYRLHVLPLARPIVTGTISSG